MITKSAEALKIRETIEKIEPSSGEERCFPPYCTRDEEGAQKMNQFANVHQQKQRNRTPLDVDISTWRNQFEVASVCELLLCLGRREKQKANHDAGTVTISGMFFKIEIALRYDELSPSGWFCFLRGNVRGRYSVFQGKQQSSKSHVATLLTFF